MSGKNHYFSWVYRSRIAKTPSFFRNQGFLICEPDDVLLSLEIQPTIIGDKVFHCPVRNGKEWGTSLWSSGKGFVHEGRILYFG